MVAVVAAADDVQPEIDLGMRRPHPIDPCIRSGRGSAALLGFRGLLVDRRLVVGGTQPVLELVLDHRQAVLVRLLVERPLPLETRLALAADMPVSIAEMLDD